MPDSQISAPGRYFAKWNPAPLLDAGDGSPLTQRAAQNAAPSGRALACVSLSNRACSGGAMVCLIRYRGVSSNSGPREKERRFR
jgi:hypothetical protein